MFDFASTNRAEGDLTDINEKGLLSYDRAVRKDAFYFYRANWNSNPTLHLTGRRYIDRAYSVIDVKVYSNATQAALQVNGRNIGVTPCTDGICTWHAVSLDPGRNSVVATATIGSAELSDSVEWTFSGSLEIVRIKCGDIPAMSHPTVFGTVPISTSLAATAWELTRPTRSKTTVARRLPATPAYMTPIGRAQFPIACLSPTAVIGSPLTSLSRRRHRAA